MDTAQLLTPAEMAEACDVTIDTLRYYEREGLLEPVRRTRGNQRRYRPDDAGWVRILRCLRVTAMPVREMRRFAELVRAGDAGIEGRLELLRAHRATVLRQRAQLDDALTVIDGKIAAYAALTGGQPEAVVESDAATPTLGGQGARA